MRAITVAIFSLCLLVATLLTGCIDDDFTTSPSHVLAFSTDTVAFDTVFTTIGTSTRSFRIYNPNKKSLNISSIKLADAEHSGFHINVDGMSGDYFTDVEIRGKDSLYVFVEANIDPTNQDNPIFIVDSIVFLTNGVQQDVKLTAYGQDVIIKRGETLSTDTRLTADRPYLIYDSLVWLPVPRCNSTRAPGCTSTTGPRCWCRDACRPRVLSRLPYRYGATGSTASLPTCPTTIWADSGAAYTSTPKARAMSSPMPM